MTTFCAEGRNVSTVVLFGKNAEEDWEFNKEERGKTSQQCRFLHCRVSVVCSKRWKRSFDRYSADESIFSRFFFFLEVHNLSI
jgi:hypothetical protein